MVQTKFGPDIGFSMRTFWFDAQTSSATGQSQTMECEIRLDPISEVSSTQPDDCTCYTCQTCQNTGGCSGQGNGQGTGQGKIPINGCVVFVLKYLKLIAKTT